VGVDTIAFNIPGRESTPSRRRRPCRRSRRRRRSTATRSPEPPPTRCRWLRARMP
jgi:hypothetical protein